MDLKQLKTFIRVAETGSLSKASDRLRLAQPALSRHIKLLEAEIGIQLFVRHGRGMELTNSGQELLKRVGGLVGQLEKSLDDVRGLPFDPRGHVAIGLIPTISHILAIRVARRVKSELPRVSLRIVEGLADSLVEWLQRGDIDLSLLPGPGADLHVRSIDLLYEQYVLVGPPDSDLSPDIAVPVRSLAELEMVLPGRPDGKATTIEAAAEKAGVALNISLEVHSLPLTLNLVENGFGYTVLPLSAIHQEFEAGRFRIAPLEKPRITRQLILAFPTSRADTRATVAVSQVIVEEIAQLVKDGVLKGSPDTGLLKSLGLMDGQDVRLSASTGAQL